VKFIVDQQLPPLLAEWLRSWGFDAVHTRELDRKNADDDYIWAVACETGAVVISKDEDFVQLQVRRPEARLVWVRIGNCDNQTLVGRFEVGWSGVFDALESGEDFVQLR
jgi:predicted nuclease of predicted toxin-antitoxin system